MKRLALLAAVSAMLAASGAHAATPSGPGKPTVTLNYLEIVTNFVAATIPPNQPPKFGDRFAIHSELYKWNGAERGALFGHTDATFVVLAPNVGQAAFRRRALPGGTLLALGEINSDSPVNTFAVVGGTGIYATARGELTVRSLGGPNSNKNAITVRLWM